MTEGVRMPGRPASPWAKSLAQRIGAQVARHRATRKLDAKDVAARTEQLGYPISVPVLYTIERGIRDAVTVAELLVLARALDVVPLDLLTAPGVHADIEVMPGVFVSPGRALAWLAGRAPLPGQDWGHPLDPGRAATGFAESHEKEERNLRLTMESAKSDELDGLLRVYANFRSIWWVREAMRGRGLVPPKLSDDLAWVERVPYDPGENHPLSSVDSPDELPVGFRPGGPLIWEEEP